MVNRFYLRLIVKQNYKNMQISQIPLKLKLMTSFDIEVNN